MILTGKSHHSRVKTNSYIFVFSIHPRTKQDVGYRLSRSGLAVAYGQVIEFQGPIISSVAYISGIQTVNITYRSVSDIEVRNIAGFEVCCHGSSCLNDDLWVSADITDKDALIITVTVPDACVGQQLTGLRYLWRETPCLFKQAAIYSASDSNLPSPPFIHYF